MFALCTPWQEGSPSFLTVEVPLSFLMWGTPILPDGDTPLLPDGGTPILPDRGYPHQGVNPCPDQVPGQDGGYPHGLDWMGVLPLGLDGVLPPSGLDGGISSPPPVSPGWGYPPPSRQSSRASTCYAVGGMPLAFTQDDFLVTFCV